MNAEEMAKEGFYLVKSVIRCRHHQGWLLPTLWEGFGVEKATWKPFSGFVLPEGRQNSVMVHYLSQSNLGELLREKFIVVSTLCFCFSCCLLLV